MNVDWGRIITEVLVIILPTILTYVLAYAAKEWTELKRNEKYKASIQMLEDMAETFVKAAFIYGEQQGWDGDTRKAFVIERLQDVISGLAIKFTDEQIERIVDAVIEAAYGDFKAWDQKRLNIAGIGGVSSPEDIIEAGMAETGSYGTIPTVSACVEQAADDSEAVLAAEVEISG